MPKQHPMSLLGSCLVALAGMGSAGCADHRISLAEFLQLQEESRNAGEASQPENAEPAAAQIIDEHFRPYATGPSDVLVVSLTGADRAALFAPLQVRVDRDGEIDLPIVGPLQVGDLELEDVEEAIHRAYVPNVVKDAAVHVELVTPDVTDVFVYGAVIAPGRIELRRNERNLLNAIIGAGGATELASGRVTLRRIRQPQEQVSFNLREPEELEASLSLDALERGDIIFVDAAETNAVFVGGLVNRPGPQPYAVGTQVTILQALAAASGVRTDVSPKEGTLIRRLPDGTDVHVKLNLNRLAQGKDPNIMLAAGDILWVPETLETRVQDWINQNIFIRMGATATVGYNVSGIEYLNRQSQQAGQLGGGTAGGGQFDPFGFFQQNLQQQLLQQQLVAQPAGP